MPDNLLPFPTTEQPSPKLSATAMPAWQAYLAMCTSKKDYFSLLESLDKKSNQGLEATPAEEVKLKQLLGKHGQNVLAFNQAMQAIDSTEDRNQLLKAMGATKPSAG